MRKLEWSDGMNTGVEAIDNDHKELLSLICQISEAIDDGKTIDIIEEVFNRLENYIKLHFAREEALMHRCNYHALEQHIKIHHEFADKIPALKKHLLSTNSLESAEEVHLFLFNWLINHILAEDMRFVQTIHEHGLANDTKQQKGVLNKFALWLGYRLNLGHRVLMTALLPITAIFFLSLFILWGHVRQLNEMESLLGLFQIVPEINELNHNLQIERGLTTGLISSNYQGFSPALNKQRQASDIAVKKFLEKVYKLPTEFINKALSAHIKQTRILLTTLKEKRSLIDKKKSSIRETQLFYTEIITLLRDLPNSFLHFKMDSELTNNIIALTAILQLKESLGLERAIGTMAIEKETLSAEEFQDFIALIGQQQGFENIFLHTATNEQKFQEQHLYDSDAGEKIDILEKQIIIAINNKKLINMDSLQWFNTLTDRMNQLKLLADQLVRNLENKTKQKTSDLKQILYLTSAFLLGLLILALLFSRLLTHSIIYPVQRITNAMNRLSQGDRNFRLIDSFAKDELGDMARAYELCRRRLLQAEVASAISYRRKEIELQHKVQEKEHYEELASTDPLTGAVNRRKLNDLANLELARMSRYHRPLSVMMLDLDHFKNINDKHGHSNGDIVLKAFYQVCQSKVRNSDIVARIGGEEFAILMAETTLQQAHQLAERIRHGVNELAIKTDDNNTIRLTVSIGISEWNDEHFQHFDDMLKNADQALYDAKNSGRNCVVVHKKRDDPT